MPASAAIAGTESSLYSIFNNPATIYRPFVRWWWNGDKIEKDELSRELRMLKDAGIGGVEINPIKFPARTQDPGIRSVQWLSDEWIDLLEFALKEARSLGMTCDLIVGSGWPFGAEWLEGDERSQVMVVGTKKIEGPLDYEVSLFELYKEADPGISSPFSGRKMEAVSVTLTPAIINNLEDARDLSAQIPTGTIRCQVPEGKHVLYAMVKIHGFMAVIQGAPGATGPVLNHYNKEAVGKYLKKMSDTIQQKIGPLSSQIRSLFSDSLELEGANWCADMQEEFVKRRSYNIVPFLPYILYKTGAMGNTWAYDHGAEHGPAFKDMIQRMRYDFELTKAELIKERFVDVFIQWCKDNNVQSRMQAYGRGYMPLEGSFAPDIPECETWIRPGLGVEMSETDYRIGRAYTMVNKFVSSAAHLKGVKQISCEELTNIHQVFNETLELMKIAGDQSIISGVTHPIFHGFNYSPANAAFPAWVIYGTFINERNPWWPYFSYFTQYKARLSALLQQATMFADIAILSPTADLWSIYSAQNDPFPAVMSPEWQTLIWESIHQNGSACDYLSEKLIQQSKIQKNFLQFKDRRYRAIFVINATSIEPETAKKLYEWLISGGKIFFIEEWPSKSPGWGQHEQRDKEVQEWIEKMKNYPQGCYLIDKPGKNYTSWFNNLQEEHKLSPYVEIDSTDRFVTQVRYQAKDTEILIFINSSLNDSYQIFVKPSKELTTGKQAWIWNAETGARQRITSGGSIPLNLGPADLKILVFDKNKKGASYQLPIVGDNITTLNSQWTLTGHSIDGPVLTRELTTLGDLKDVEEWANFCGNLVYKTTLVVTSKGIKWMDLGKVFGVAELIINGQSAGVKWYGRRIFDIASLLQEGKNNIEVLVTTTMGNYLKSLKDNPVAQFWTNEGRTIQPLQSMGMAGPVSYG